MAHLLTVDVSCV